MSKTDPDKCPRCGSPLAPRTSYVDGLCWFNHQCTSLARGCLYETDFVLLNPTTTPPLLPAPAVATLPPTGRPIKIPMMAAPSVGLEI
jgi:hypothetical protein